MTQEFNSPAMRYFIGDVRDATRLRLAMRSVDYVIVLNIYVLTTELILSPSQTY